MAMNGTTMGDAVVQAIKGVNPKITQNDINTMNPYWEAICTAIVNHIKANGAIGPGSFTAGATAVTGATTIT